MNTLIFDLSEVLIAGLVGVEKPLALQLHLPEDKVLSAFVGDLFDALLCGEISEDIYLQQIIDRQVWSISPDALKRVIRHNFHQRVPGMESLLGWLAIDHELVLLSDHAAEWVAYIRLIHPFLRLFKVQFFSFELKQTKREPSTFLTVLDAIHREPQECLFIDDSLTNVKVAEEVGIPSIRFTNAEQLSMENAVIRDTPRPLRRGFC
jgi:FMN phosphatase YigB (HAD superfamily)